MIATPFSVGPFPRRNCLKTGRYPSTFCSHARRSRLPLVPYSTRWWECTSVRSNRRVKRETAALPGKDLRLDWMVSLRYPRYASFSPIYWGLTISFRLAQILCRLFSLCVIFPERIHSKVPLFKKYLFAPGPTPVPPEVLLEMARPIIHHRTPEFSAVARPARAADKAAVRHGPGSSAARLVRHRRDGSGGHQSAGAGRGGDFRQRRQVRRAMGQDARRATGWQATRSRLKWGRAVQARADRGRAESASGGARGPGPGQRNLDHRGPSDGRRSLRSRAGATRC